MLTREYSQATHVALVRLGKAKDALESKKKLVNRVAVVTDNMDVILGVVGVVAEVSNSF